jgi:hypothetical protein
MSGRGAAGDGKRHDVDLDDDAPDEGWKQAGCVPGATSCSRARSGASRAEVEAVMQPAESAVARTVNPVCNTFNGSYTGSHQVPGGHGRGVAWSPARAPDGRAARAS